MKKSILAAVVAASVAVVPVTAPQAWAADEADDADKLAAEPAASADTSSEEPLSPGAIVGITLGVLALVSAGTALAVQQGWIQIPGVDMAQINALFPALPTLPALPGRATNRAAAKGSCAPQEFDKAVPGWPNFTGTVVTYCDGLWAVAGANQTDWTETFRFTGGAWQRVPKRGTTYTGFGCYNGLTLREQGAPQALLDQVLICKPSEID